MKYTCTYYAGTASRREAPTVLSRLAEPYDTEYCAVYLTALLHVLISFNYSV
jgi:hypothetical protein